jgi:hypothetical protein
LKLINTQKETFDGLVCLTLNFYDLVLMFSNVKCLGLQTLVPLTKKKYGHDDLRDKDPKIVTIKFFL